MAAQILDGLLVLPGWHPTPARSFLALLRRLAPQGYIPSWQVWEVEPACWWSHTSAVPGAVQTTSGHLACVPCSFAAPWQTSSTLKSKENVPGKHCACKLPLSHPQPPGGLRPPAHKNSLLSSICGISHLVPGHEATADGVTFSSRSTFITTSSPPCLARS